MGGDREAVGAARRPRAGGARLAKMAFNFRLDGSTLSTETRVLLTDAASRRKFRAYWTLIRPFSGLIRRVWLRAIAHRAAR